MITCEQLHNIFKKNNISYFTGVPDSLFKQWMSYLSVNEDKLTNRIAANEGAAIAHATGYYLATGKVGVVYLQNSGLGNCVNPLTSLADSEVYGIPMIMMIGWRGEPDKKDEPQHKKMGRVMLALLDSLEIPYEILDVEKPEEQIKKLKTLAIEQNIPVALIVKKGSFADEKFTKDKQEGYPLTREEALRIIVDDLYADEVIISTTGKTSRELFEYRAAKKIEDAGDFYTVGSMGHTSAIALEVAKQKPNKRIFIFDGDGALIMHMGTMATIAHYAPENLVHVVFDNHCHESTGGQPTVSKHIDIPRIALACGYKQSFICETEEDVAETLSAIKSGPSIIVVKIKKGSRADLGRPTKTPEQMKNAFRASLEERVRS